MGFSLLKIAICAATRWEFDAIGKALPTGKKLGIKGYRCITRQTDNLTVFVIQTGIGYEKTAAAFHALLNDQAWDLIVSAGFAGALVPTSVGTLVVSSRVLVLGQDNVLESRLHRGEEVSPFWGIAQTVSEQMGGSPLLGSVVMVQRIVCEAKHKASIARQTQGLALDMESGTIGKLATDRRIPFLVVRTISDLVDESLPLDLNVLWEKSSWMQGIFSLVTHPRQLWQFNRLRKQMIVASEQLTRFFQGFCVQLERCV
ncbi:MAG: hypothetical protein VST68_09355 [Nitrospirota bacterium]|nr:hypothetical protein [Nitrospirota bacterium]